MTTGGPASPRGSFERTVAALVDSIVRARIPGAPAPVSDVTRFVLAQHGRMPTHLRAAVRLVTLALAWGTVLRGGRPFHAAPAGVQDTRLARWRRARLAPCRDVVRFWESLVVYGCFAASERDGR